MPKAVLHCTVATVSDIFHRRYADESNQHTRQRICAKRNRETRAGDSHERSSLADVIEMVSR